jgi:hypothetical protein
MLGTLLRRGLSFLDGHPSFRRYGTSALRRLGLQGAVRAAYGLMLRATGNSGIRLRHAPLTAEADALTRRTRQILAQLHAARRDPKANR